MNVVQISSKLQSSRSNFLKEGEMMDCFSLRMFKFNSGENDTD